jgi:hypothetical protein
MSDMAEEGKWIESNRPSRTMLRASNAETRVLSWSAAKQDYARRVASTTGAKVYSEDPQPPKDGPEESVTFWFWTGPDFAMIDNGDGTLSMPKEVIEKLRAAKANDR